MKLSVVIPAYNSAEFLPTAIDSVLAQTVSDIEIIVVNDGSTDDTPTVLAKYGDAIRVIHQENRGLAGARNTGIEAATSELVGLLDADDIWLPTFCGTFLRLAAAAPTASAYYGGAQCMTADGQDLPQSTACKVVSPDNFYEEMVRANWMVPSAMVLRRSAVIEAGLFDPTFRAAEDWELWLRLGKEQPFVGTSNIVMRYRLHGSSLSADYGTSHKHKIRALLKHFGPNDGKWTPIKRIAYGGTYRHLAIMQLIRAHDWEKAAESLHTALQADHSLADEIDLLYEFALGTQTLGKRGVEFLSVASLEVEMRQLIAVATVDLAPQIEKRLAHTAYFALALAAYNGQQPCVSYALRAIRLSPFSRNVPQLLKLVAKSWLRPLRPTARLDASLAV